MELTWTEQHKLTNARSILITYSIDDILDLQLSPFDHRFVRECEQSGKLSDKLLLLEFYARKLEERADKTRTSTPCRTET